MSVEKIHAKLAEIYYDLSYNVTHIYGRTDLHLAIDLVYHSPIRFKFDTRMLEKGYPEILIIGDTRAGKSQCAEALMRHYGLGVMAQAEAVSYAGLIGGLQKVFDARWDITWGKIPQNNRRLVVLDEASGLDPETIGKLSSIRSSGVATIEKIASQRTEAKTRLIWISNPRGRETVSHFSSGVYVIQSLCNQPEDIARWDMALVVAKDDVDVSKLRETRGPNPPHKYTSSLCRDLILWAWTREAHEVKFTKGATDAAYKFGSALGKKYSSDFTLVIGAEQPVKLARLATGLAGRLFSTSNGTDLVVTADHVQYIYEYLQRVYNSDAFGYDAWSENRTSGSQIRDINEVMAFLERLGRNGCYKFLDIDRLRLRDIEEYLGITADEAKSILSKLLLNNALKRAYGDYYHKSPDFTKLLRRFAAAEDCKAAKGDAL